MYASSSTDRVPPEACRQYASSVSEQVPLEACRQYASSGSERMCVGNSWYAFRGSLESSFEVSWEPFGSLWGLPVRFRFGAVQWRGADMRVRMGTSTSVERSRGRDSRSAEELMGWQSVSVFAALFYPGIRSGDGSNAVGSNRALFLLACALPSRARVAVVGDSPGRWITSCVCASSGARQAPLAACRVYASSGSDETPLEAYRLYASSGAEQVLLQACRMHAARATDQAPLAPCRLYASSGTDQLPLEACRLYAFGGAGQVPLEARRL